MSDNKHTSSDTPKGGPQYRIAGDGFWTHAWKVAGVLGVLGLALSAFAASADSHRFAFSWLFAFFTFFSVAIGSLFFVVLQHLVGAGWSVTVRRTAEFFASGLFIFALFFAPIWFFRGELYPWLSHGEHHAAAPSHEGAEHGAPAAEHDEHGAAAGDHHAASSAHHGTPAEVAHHAVVAKKSSYLNFGFWTGRAVAYFAIWILLSFLYFSWSTKQDSTKDPSLTVKAQKLAPISMAAFALTLTFAAFDWMMSLEPSWYSTIYGVNVFAGCAVATFSTIALVTISFRSSGLIGNAVNEEHFHDLGKLAFAFNVFWAYISFSQMMLIWYANIPEETSFYHIRWDASGWKSVSLVLVLGHFVAPFLFLMSRNVKRRVGLLAFGLVWLLVMHVVDMYWFVMPHYRINDFAPSWVDLACLFGVGGTFLALVFYRMTSHSLIPRGDPRLERALHFQNA